MYCSHLIKFTLGITHVTPAESNDMILYFRDKYAEIFATLQGALGGESGLIHLVVQYAYGDDLWSLMHHGHFAARA
jgi:hypothetical protein